MQDKYRLFKSHCVDGAISPAHIVLNHFEDTSSTKSLEGLHCWMRTSLLREVQGISENLPHIGWKFQKVFSATADPFKRAFVSAHIHFISELV